MIEIQILDVLQLVAVIIMSALGIGIRSILKRMTFIENQIVQYRKEMKDEFKEYVRKELCRTHRENMQRQINEIARVYGIMHMSKSGMAVVDINDPDQMHDLYNSLTPEQRKAHAERCAFRSEHNEIANGNNGQ